MKLLSFLAEEVLLRTSCDQEDLKEATRTQKKNGVSIIRNEEGEDKDKSNTQRIRRCKKIFSVTERKERHGIFYPVQSCKAMLFQKVLLKREKHEKKEKKKKGILKKRMNS